MGPEGPDRAACAHWGSRQEGHETGLAALFIDAVATEDEELGRTSTAVFSKLALSRLNFIPSK